MNTRPLLCLALIAALTQTASAAPRAFGSSKEWRTKVLGPEGRLHDDPRADFDGTIGPQYIYKNGWWYTADMGWVYHEGRWVEPHTVVRIEERTLVVKRAPEGD